MEIVGRTVFDTPPRFPIPRELRGPVFQGDSVAPQPSLRDLQDGFPHLLPLVQALTKLTSIAEIANNNTTSKPFWQDEIAAIRMIGPITHDLLTTARLSAKVTGTPSVFLVAESARLACLILLSGLKKRFSLASSDMIPLQAKLAAVLDQKVGVLDASLARLRLWAVITSALVLSNDMRMHLVPHIRASIRDQGLANCRDALGSAKNYIWMDAIEANEISQLVEEVDSGGDNSDSWTSTYTFDGRTPPQYLEPR